MKILLVNGSVRKEHTTHTLLEKARKGFEEQECETELIHLIDTQFPHKYVYDEDNEPTRHPTPEVRAILDKMVAADGIVFGTPTYWMSRSSLMQSLLEHLTVEEYNPPKIQYPLYGKVAGIIVTGTQGGNTGVAAQLAVALSHFGFLIPPFGICWHSPHMKHTQENWNEHVPALIVQEMLQALHTYNTHGQHTQPQK